MSPDPSDVIENSLLYRATARLLYWTRQSVMERLLRDEGKLIALLCLVLTLSVVRVLLSDMQPPVKFLSFALLFVSLVALTWNYTKPLTDE